MIEIWEGPDADREVADWVAVQLGYRPGDMGVGRALGVTMDGKPIAGAVLNQIIRYEHGAVGVGSIASTDRRWATRRTLRAIFEVPFVELGLTRLMTWCLADRPDIRRFNERLGFVYEGTGRRAFDGVRDAAAFSMLPEECRWINGK